MVDASGNLLTLHTFAGPPTDGAQPSGPLTRDAAGNLYGTTSMEVMGLIRRVTEPYSSSMRPETRRCSTTSLEGKAARAPGAACSEIHMATCTASPHSGGLPCQTRTVVELSSGWNLTARSRLCIGLPRMARRAQDRNSGLIPDAAGNLYGVTSGGTLAVVAGNGRGTVFRIDSAGVFTTLYDFATDSVAAYPRGPLMRDDAGNLYGVTASRWRRGRGNYFQARPRRRAQHPA